jgi:hypothetical protein
MGFASLRWMNATSLRGQALTPFTPISANHSDSRPASRTAHVGTNALVIALRYGVLEADATAAMVASASAFVVTAGLWLAVLAALTPS